MASKRMFSKDITGSDAFCEMPSSTQALYFHLGMEADDDGFIGNPKKVMRVLGASEDDYKILLTKKFLLLFESGVVVVKHHRINNNWDKYNCKRTVYLEEFSQLNIKENKAYTLDKSQGIPTQSDFSLQTVFRIEENRINKGVAIAPPKYTIKKEPEETPDKPNPIIPSPYSVQSTRERWMDGEMRLVILSWFLDEKKLWPDSRAKLQAIMRRHNKSAIRLANAGWTKKEVVEAKSKALFSEQMRDEWTLDTIEKYLTK